MPTLADVRAQIPDLSGLDDDQAVDALHQAYYPDLTREQVAESLGVKPQVKTEKSSLIRRAVGDTGISLVKGAIGVPEAAVGLADIVTGGEAGKAAESVGFRPKEARDYLDTFLSPEQQAANKAVQDAHGVVDVAKAAITNPSVVVQNAIESVPSMLGGGVLARGAMRLLPRMAGFAAAGIGEGAVSAGQTAEQVRQESPGGTLTGTQSAIAAGSGALTGVLGVIAGKVANKLGIGDIDTMIAGGLKGPPNAAQKSFVRQLLEGAASEGVLEELPQSTQEQVAQNWALGKPLDEGVDQAAILGMFAGGLMGAGAQVVHGHAPHVEEVGTLSRAANIGIDANAEIARSDPAPLAPAVEPVVMPAGMPSAAALAARGIEPGMDALHQAGARDAQELRQWDRSAPEETPAPAAEPDTWQPGDVLNKQGAPFTNKGAALRAQKANETPDAYAVQPVQGGFVLRPTAPAAPIAPGDVSRSTEVVSQPDVAAIDTEAHKAAESPHNDLPEPTDAQKEAGNYVKGHVRIDGMDVSIENPKGSMRRSKADDPNPWQVEMPAHYGYIRGTTGADGDHVDLSIGPLGNNGRYWVINQHHAGEPTKFDEHKVFTGVDSAEHAVSLYKQSFADNFGDKVFTSVSDELSPDELKAKLPSMSKPQPIAPAATTTQVTNEPNAQAGTEQQISETAPQAAPEAAAVPTVAATESAGPAVAGSPALESARLAANDGATEPAETKGLADRRAGGADDLARLTQTESFAKQGLRGLDVEGQRVVLSAVGHLVGDLEIRRRVVQLVPVDVMHVLAGKKGTAKRLLSDPAVLKNLSTVETGAAVPAFVDAADTLVRVVARATAEQSGVADRAGGLTVEKSAAVAADDSNANSRVSDLASSGAELQPARGASDAGGATVESGRAARALDKGHGKAPNDANDATKNHVAADDTTSQPVAEAPADEHVAPAEAANDEPAPRPENVIELRKRASVLESLRKCLAA